MEKRISYDVFQSVKRVAQACNPLIVKRDKALEKIEAIKADCESYDAQVAALEAGVKQITGFRVEELVKKVVNTETDAAGNVKKTTKYVPTDIVTYDKDRRQYVIVTDVEEPVAEEDNATEEDVVTDEEATPSEGENVESTFEPAEEPQEEDIDDVPFMDAGDDEEDDELPIPSAGNDFDFDRDVLPDWGGEQ